MKIVFVIGANGVGKSTFMDQVKRFNKYGTVEVGRMMRAKYPPEHFAGQSNPKHTAEEAWQMLLDGMAVAFVAGKEAVFCDGQPCDIEQAEKCLRRWPKAIYLHLYADDATRIARCEARDKDNPAASDLARKRYDTDSINNYKVLCHLMQNGANILTDHIDQKDSEDSEQIHQAYRGTLCMVASTLTR